MNAKLTTAIVAVLVAFSAMAVIATTDNSSAAETDDISSYFVGGVLPEDEITCNYYYFYSFAKRVDASMFSTSNSKINVQNIWYGETQWSRLEGYLSGVTEPITITISTAYDSHSWTVTVVPVDGSVTYADLPDGTNNGGPIRGYYGDELNFRLNSEVNPNQLWVDQGSGLSWIVVDGVSVLTGTPHLNVSYHVVAGSFTFSVMLVEKWYDEYPTDTIVYVGDYYSFPLAIDYNVYSWTGSITGDDIGISLGTFQLTEGFVQFPRTDENPSFVGIITSVGSTTININDGISDVTWTVTAIEPEIIPEPDQISESEEEGDDGNLLERTVNLFGYDVPIWVLFLVAIAFGLIFGVAITKTGGKK
jgi:hypothetical protein